MVIFAKDVTIAALDNTAGDVNIAVLGIKCKGYECNWRSFSFLFIVFAFSRLVNGE